MKVREGFVSNSSSSSFIIAVKNSKAKICECCGQTIGGELSSKIESALNGSQWCDTEIDMIEPTKEEAIHYLKDNFWFDPGEMESYIEAINSLGDSYKIIEGSVSNHDELVKELLRSPSIITIYRGEE